MSTLTMVFRWDNQTITPYRSSEERGPAIGADRTLCRTGAWMQDNQIGVGSDAKLP